MPHLAFDFGSPDPDIELSTQIFIIFFFVFTWCLPEPEWISAPKRTKLGGTRKWRNDWVPVFNFWYGGNARTIGHFVLAFCLGAMIAAAFVLTPEWTPGTLPYRLNLTVVIVLGVLMWLYSNTIDFLFSRFVQLLGGLSAIFMLVAWIILAFVAGFFTIFHVLGTAHGTAFWVTFWIAFVIGSFPIWIHAFYVIAANAKILNLGGWGSRLIDAVDGDATETMGGKLLAPTREGAPRFDRATAKWAGSGDRARSRGHDHADSTPYDGDDMYP